MPQKQLKYEPIQFDRWLFMRKKQLVQMDERDRLLSAQYAQIMKSPAVIFMHENNLTVDETKRLRLDLKKKNILMTRVNSRIFRGLLVDSQYANYIPLLNGPTVVCWPSDSYRAADDLMVNSGVWQRVPLAQRQPMEFDSISFAKDAVSTLMASIAVRKKIILLGGKMQDSAMGPKELVEYTKMPSRHQMLAGLMGVLEQPQLQLVSGLQYHGHSLVRLLEAHQQQSQTNAQN